MREIQSRNGGKEGMEVRWTGGEEGETGEEERELMGEGRGQEEAEGEEAVRGREGR